MPHAPGRATCPCGWTFVRSLSDRREPIDALLEHLRNKLTQKCPRIVSGDDAEAERNR